MMMEVVGKLMAGRLGRRCKVQNGGRRRKWSSERGHSLPLMSSLNFWPQNSLHDYTEKMELHPPHANSLSVYHMWSLPPEFMAQETTRPLHIPACVPRPLPYAFSLFTLIEEPNAHLWNTMIKGYSMTSNALDSILYHNFSC
nr:pentatricopeptide repeat-containing protein At1g50270 [Ipomoea trifida]